MPNFPDEKHIGINYTVTHELVIDFIASIRRKSTIFPLHCNLALMGKRSEELLYIFLINLNTSSVVIKVYISMHFYLMLVDY